jgi:hypothetical protein
LELSGPAQVDTHPEPRRRAAGLVLTVREPELALLRGDPTGILAPAERGMARFNAAGMLPDLLAVLGYPESALLQKEKLKFR